MTRHDHEVLTDGKDEPYKFTTISKDLREVHAITGDFLVQEGQVTFLITDRKGDMRMLDFDPAGKVNKNKFASRLELIDQIPSH